MQVFRNLNSIQPGTIRNGIITIGNFDGVHRGHKALLGQTVEIAKKQDATACAVTFWPHPQSVVGDGAPFLVGTLEQRIHWIEETGIDVLVVQTFDPEFSTTEPADFLRLLNDTLDAVHLVLGHDFHFGKGGAGNIELARQYADECSFEVSEFEQVFLEESVVSSSHVREVLAAGDVRKAHEYLGRPWQIWGQAVSGAGRGRTLGFPTVNFETDNEVCIPDGVYGGRITLADGTTKVAAISVGVNPTFGNEPRHVEAFILDCEEPAVDGELTLEFLTYLRAQVTYTDAAKLIEQIEVDVEMIRDQAQRESWAGIAAG